MRSARIVLTAGWVVVLLTVVGAWGAVNAQAALTHSFIGAFGPDGTEASTFNTIGALALDQSNGDLFVEDSSGKVFKFGPQGEPRDFAALGSNELAGLSLRFTEAGINGLGVNPTTHDLYVAENLGTQQIGVYKANGEPGEFSALASSKLGGFSELCGVAVDAEGFIYAGDYPAGVTVYAPSGELLATIPTVSGCGLAVDSNGDIFLNYWHGAVVEFTPDSYPVTATTTYTETAQLEGPENYSVAVEPTSDDLYVNKRHGIVFHDPAGTIVGRFAETGAGAISDSEGFAVLGPEGLAFAADQASARVKRYGPAEVEPPAVEKEWATPVLSEEATLHAQINPLGNQSSLVFEFGPLPCEVGGCATTAPINLGVGQTPITASATVNGLVPGATYHFRARVSGSQPDVLGADRTFRPPVRATNLPDGRGYELVSPAGSESGAQFGLPTGIGAGGIVDVSGVRPQRAADNGEAVAYASYTAVGDAVGTPAASTYLSRRAAGGWSIENITPSDQTFRLMGPVRGFSNDLGESGVVTLSQPLAPGPSADFEAVYLRDNLTGSYRAITAGVPKTEEPRKYCPSFVGWSGDGSHVLFSANGALTPDAHTTELGKSSANLYDWSASEGLRLVNVLPGGAAVVPGVTTLGFGAGAGNCFPGSDPVTRDAISSDGRTIFWSSQGQLVFERETFARINGSETIQLDAAAGGPDPGGGGEFLTASADGRRAFFTDRERLVPGASPGDLYEYNLPARQLKDLTLGAAPAEVQGLAAASEDGSRLYFVAQGNLAPGAVAGQENLYLWHEGGITLVAVLSGEDSRVWRSTWYATTGEGQSARATADGRYLAFTSVRPLTGYENEIQGSSACDRISGSASCPEVFLYDAVNGTLRCASCNPNGSSPSAETPPVQKSLNTLPAWASPTEQLRYLNQDGSRLFFESYESLKPSDNNGREDVYEFEPLGSGGCAATSADFSAVNGGCVALISSGTSDDDSYFLDASASGNDVFFSTRQNLVPADTDGRFDVYDARVGGGFPERPTPPTGCSGGEGCRPAAALAEAAAPGSASFSGPGNLKPQKCPKGKVKQHGRCVKRPASHHAKKKKGAAHRRGGHRKGQR